MMKKILLILLLAPLMVFSQSRPYPIRGYDHVYIFNGGTLAAPTGNTELTLANSTRALTNAFLKNIGGGLTEFAYPVIGDITGLQDALDGKVPLERQITINGETHDLATDPTFTVSVPLYRFGKSTEDESAAENRAFNLGIYDYSITAGSSSLSFSGSSFGAQIFSGADGGRLYAGPGYGGIGVEDATSTAGIEFNMPANSISYLVKPGMLNWWGTNSGTWNWEIRGLQTGTASKQLYFDDATKRVMIGDAPSSSSFTWGGKFSSTGSFGGPSATGLTPAIQYTGIGGHTLTLPSLSGNAAQSIRIKNAGSGNVTIATAGGSDVIYTTSSVASVTLAPGESIMLVAMNSTTWQSYFYGTSAAVTAVSVATANGFAGSSSGGATPSLTLSTTVSGILKGSSGSLSAATAGDFPTLNQNTTGSAASLTTSRNIFGVAFNGTADVTGTPTTSLATGIVKSTSGTLGVATAGDFPTLNQNTTGSAATLTTSRNIYGNAFNGSADVTGIIASTYGGTGNGFAKFTGPASTEKTFTLPNSSATILTSLNTSDDITEGSTNLFYTAARAALKADITHTHPIADITGLGTGVATFLSTPSSANLLAALTTKTGTGNAVFSASPTFTGTVGAATVNATGDIQVTGAASEILTGTSHTTPNFVASNYDNNSSNAATVPTGIGTVRFRIKEVGSTNLTPNANESVFYHIIGNQLGTENATGTHDWWGQLLVRPLTLTNAAGNSANLATVYIEGAATGVTPTGRNDAFRVGSGSSYFGGDIQTAGSVITSLSSGIVKSTSGTLGVATAGDFPTLNQNTTGSAATLTTSRNIYGNAFDGSADVTSIIASTYGGTGNGFAKFTGPASTEKTFTLPNSSATILTDLSTTDNLTEGSTNKYFTDARARSAMAIGSANQVLGMDAAGTAVEGKTVAGTTNEVDVTHAAGSITIDLPNAMVEAYDQRVMDALGSSVKAQTIGMTMATITNTVSLTSGNVNYVAVWVPYSFTCTGVKWWMGTLFSGTGNNTNDIALFSFSAGTLTKIAETAASTTFFSTGATANSLMTTAWQTPVALTGGQVYYVSFLYSSSAQTTAPSLGGQALVASGVANGDYANSSKICAIQSGQTAQPATTKAMSALSQTTFKPYAGLY